VKIHPWLRSRDRAFSAFSAGAFHEMDPREKRREERSGSTRTQVAGGHPRPGCASAMQKARAPRFSCCRRRSGRGPASGAGRASSCPAIPSCSSGIGSVHGAGTRSTVILHARSVDVRVLYRQVSYTPPPLLTGARRRRAGWTAPRGRRQTRRTGGGRATRST
jgi:hypothetical protein